MEVPVNWMADAAQVCAASTDTQLRVFYVEHNPWQATSLVVRDNVVGHWAVCTPDVCNNFSGVAYFFARELRAKLKRPVGVIGSYVGGTPASSWISLSGLMKAPAFTKPPRPSSSPVPCGSSRSPLGPLIFSSHGMGTSMHDEIGTTPAGQPKVAVPWFVGFFLLASVPRSYVPGVAHVAPALSHVATEGLT